MNEQTAELISEGSLVELHFSLGLTTGETIDSNFSAKPARFRVGDGSMLPGFEECLLGLHAGSEIDEVLPAEKAFGAVNPKNKQQFPIAKFQHLLDDDLIPTEIGSVVSFRDPGGGELPGVITAVTEEYVAVDFNHPLAGKEIEFKARIISVLAADQQAVEVKLS